MATIAVTGATGVVGGGVARLLSERGLATRLVVRQPARAPALAHSEVRRASSYGAGDEMRAALEGCETLCLIPAEESADRVTQHKTAVDAAVAAGVERIVYLSIVAPAPDATFTLARDHWATEQHVRAAGVAHAFARMNLYLDFVPMMVGPDGAIRGPAGDGRLAAVSRADVAAVTADVVAGDDRDGRAYDITGREAPTLAEFAATLSAVSGKRIAVRRRVARRGARVARVLRRARLAGRGVDQHLHRGRRGRARGGLRHRRAGDRAPGADARGVLRGASGRARPRALDCLVHRRTGTPRPAYGALRRKEVRNVADPMPALPATLVRGSRRGPGELPVLRRSAGRGGAVAGWVPGGPDGRPAALRPLP